MHVRRSDRALRETRRRRLSGLAKLLDPTYVFLPLLLALSAAAPSYAQDPARFYAGRTITFVVGYTTGASYDSQARILTKSFGRHIPGKPNVVIQNMPGAGSITSANYLFNVAPKDGTVIGLFARGMFLEALFEGPGVRFDPLKFNWIGSHAKEVSVVLSGIDTPFKTVDDIKSREMVVGATGPGADTHSFPLLLNSVIGTKFKIVSGYPGNAEALLAVERREVQGNSGTSIGSLAALRPAWMTEKGHVNFITQLALERHPKQLQGVPLIMDYAASDLDRAALALGFSRQSIAYAFTAPPDVPADRVQALRDAFMATTRDPDFIADAERLYTEIDPLTGPQVLDVIKRAYATPKEAIARTRDAVMPPPGK